jgi:hypothetical protein
MTSGDLVAQYRLFAPHDDADPDDPDTVSLDTLVDYLTACRSLVKHGDQADYEALTYVVCHCESRGAVVPSLQSLDTISTSFDTSLTWSLGGRGLTTSVNPDRYGMELAAIIIVGQGTYHLNSGEKDTKSWAAFLHRVYDCFFRGTTNRSSSRSSLSSYPRSFSAGLSPSPSRSSRGTPALLDESMCLLRQTDDRTVVDLLRRLREYCELFHG